MTAPGLYVIEYNGVTTDPFPIDDNAYSETWQSSLSGFLATAMDHIEVRQGYKIWHAASHMDDARIAEPYPGSVVNPATNQIPWFDGKVVPMILPQILQDRGYALGDRIPNLAQGGWYDAGDFDIEISRNYSVLRDLVYNAEAFDNMGDYDTLSVEWDEDTGGTVEMQRPDGVPDIVQQVKHGAMAILGLYENVGFASGSIEVPTLRQYTHLGEGATDTDGFIYDPSLGENEVAERIDPADGKKKVYSGKNDDRMLMSTQNAIPTSNLGVVSVGLAGAANVTREFYPEFADACLDAAKEIWADHGAWALTQTGQRANTFNTLVQLMLATEGTADYGTYRAAMDQLLAQTGPGDNPFTTILPIATGYTYSAAFVMDLMDQAFRDNVIAAVNATAPTTYAPVPNSPFGLPDSLTSTWGPGDWIGLPTGQMAAILYNTLGNQVNGTASTAMKDFILRMVNYIVGTHPYNDTSWLVGVGEKSHKYPYNSNRADNGFIPGSIVPGYVNFKPDFPESLDNFQFLWAENEAIIDYSSRFMPIGLAADMIAKAASPAAAPATVSDFVGEYDWEVQETPGYDYFGNETTPYETLTTPGLDVFMYNSTFSTIFGDQHSAGVELVLNGERVATNGDIHLLPTPEQWDATPPPTLIDRSSDAATKTVSATLTLPGVTGDAARPEVGYTMEATPEAGGLKLTVTLDKTLPADLAGKAGFNMEFIPDLYKEKGYMADSDGDGKYDDFGVIPLLPFDEMEVKDRARTDDQAWYVREWNTDRGDYQPVPFAAGKTVTLAPDTENRVRVTSDTGEVQLLDGRNRAQNGWFVLRTLFPAGSQQITWHIAADVDTSWVREPNVGHSQAGYAPGQSKVAVIELDPDFAAPATASVERLNADGTYSTVYTGRLDAAKRWLRYDYRNFDFSAVTTPGIYVISYAGVRTDLFPIADDVYGKSWQQALTGFLGKEMDHIAVRETYKIVHAASHMDDAILYPLAGEPFRDEAAWDGTWFDGQDFLETSRDYAGNSLDRVPGQAVGGWYDAGDFDLEATRQAGVIQDLAIAWREFHPQYDTMDVDWDTTTGGMVELHRADGVPDVVQQVKHGALNVLARVENVGYNYKVVEVPTLRQYTHLGDGSSETDNRYYDATLAEDEVSGLSSGKQDDRLAMVGEKDPALQYYAAYALAAANTVVKGYDDAFAQRALTAAKNIWQSEDLILSLADLNLDPTDFMGMYMALGQISAEFNAAIELLLATGDSQYRDAIVKLWPLVKSPAGFGVSFASAGWKAALVLDHMDAAFKAEFRQAIADFKAYYDESVAANPWGMPDSIGMWGGSTDVVDVGVKMYFLHQVDPYTIPADYSLNAATYILGTHADDDTSWLSGVGTSSITHAYGNTRADDTFVAGGIIPGYVPIAPDLPEAKDGFGMMWFESEYVIDTSAKWVVLGNAINALLVEDPSTWPDKPAAPAPTATKTVSVPQPGPTVTVKALEPGPTVTQPGPTVTVTSPAGGDGPVTGVGSKVVSVKASQPTVRLVKGSSARLYGYGYTAAGKQVKATWSSSKKSVASVSSAGKVTAKKAGSATITVRAGGKTAKVKVTVVAKKPAASVTSVRAAVPKTMPIGRAKNVTAKWSPTSVAGAVARYTSSNKAVVTIDKAGRIVAKAKGTAKITVKVGAKSKTYKVTVR
ncbi:MAG: glycoside hydrolase family 9 protein [Bifidobacteriaceae bacterium]|nr:glycoside hydrolase family 9 protein [Bifidobacteriaceae bacterium]